MKERELEAVLKSRTFSRSEQLQGFLRYICELELAGRGNEITEYSIATGALHRPSDYAPSENSSVRSRAHSLRHKLQEYYESEAEDVEWRIELPKGSYRPLFVKRAPASAAAPAPVTVGIPSLPPEDRKASGPKFRSVLPGLLLTVVIGTLVMAFVFNRQGTGGVESIVRDAWGPTLSSNSDVLILVGCPPMVRFSRSAKGVHIKSNRLIPAPEDILSWYGDQNLDSEGNPLYLTGSRGYTVFADMVATNQVAALLTKAGSTFQTTPETVIPLMTVHERGLVVIGAPAYTGIAARVLKATPFSIRYDEALRDEVITDGHTVYAPVRDSTDRFSTVYGLITVLPSQPGKNRPERTMIFSGITASPGAQAGVQFFSSAAALRDLRKRFQKEGYRDFPPAYQVVVRCGVDKEAAINSVYENHRIMASTPVIQ